LLIGYGKHDEDYVRIALTVEEKRLEEAIERLKKSESIYNRIKIILYLITRLTFKKTGRVLK